MIFFKNRFLLLFYYSYPNFFPFACLCPSHLLFPQSIPMLLSMFVDHSFMFCLSGVQPVACRPHAAQHGHRCGPTQIVNLLKTLWKLFVIMCLNAFNVCPNTTLPLPVGHRNAWRLDTPMSLPLLSTIIPHPTPQIPGHFQCVSCFQACGSILFVSLFCSLDSSYR